MVFLQKLRLAGTDRSYWEELFKDLPFITEPDQQTTTYKILAATNNRYWINYNLILNLQPMLATHASHASLEFPQRFCTQKGPANQAWSLET